MHDPIADLKREHRDASSLLRGLAASKRPTATRANTAEKLAAALTLHMEIEERLVYPLVQRRVGADQEQEAEIEHRLARDGIATMLDLIGDPGFGAAVAMLTAGIKHHVHEEETEVFPALKKQLTRDELAELGDAVAAMKKRDNRSREKTRVR